MDVNRAAATGREHAGAATGPVVVLPPDAAPAQANVPCASDHHHHHHHHGIVADKKLFDATKRFASENVFKSWWSVATTFLILGGSLGIAALAPWWPLRLVASVFGGLMLVRSFILFHDHMHGALLRKSKFARQLFQALGLVMLTPSRYWRYSHNFHHGIVCKPLPQGDNTDGPTLVASDLGSFPLMTVEAWKKATFWQRLRYRVVRHPVTMVAAYFTVFMFGLTLLPFFKNPKRYWDGAVALAVHGAVIAGFWALAGPSVVLFAFVLPYAISTVLGAYLFYAQHNHEDLNMLEPEEWTYYRGAYESSSYMRLGKIMDWFTGNIGYHHIHHMNPLIPFYRLPEAMAAIPELQEAGRTSLLPGEIFKCLRLNLWDPQREKLVSYRGD